MAKFDKEDLRRLAAKGGPEARKVAREALGVYAKDEVDRLAMKVLGVLAGGQHTGATTPCPGKGAAHARNSVRKEVSAMEIHQERSVKMFGLKFSCKADLRVDPPGKKPSTASTISFHFTGYKGPA